MYNIRYFLLVYFILDRTISVAYTRKLPPLEKVLVFNINNDFTLL